MIGKIMAEEKFAQDAKNLRDSSAKGAEGRQKNKPKSGQTGNRTDRTYGKDGTKCRRPMRYYEPSGWAQSELA